MKSNVKSVKKLPDFEKTVQFVDKNGKVQTKTVKVTDHYLVQLNEFNSVVLAKGDFKKFGVNVELPEEKATNTVTFGVQNSSTVAKPNATLTEVDPK